MNETINEHVSRTAAQIIARTVRDSCPAGRRSPGRPHKVRREILGAPC